MCIYMLGLVGMPRAACRASLVANMAEQQHVQTGSS